MEADAEAVGEAKIEELQQSLNDTQQRLAELQQQKTDKDQRYILSPEQKTEIDNFRKQQAEVSKQLKQAQKDLRKEVISLETRLTWLQHTGRAACRDGGGRDDGIDQTEKDFGEMNRKQFIILLALVVVVGAAGLIIHQRGNESWQNAGQTIGQKLLPDLPVNDVAQITIQSGTNELTLARRDNLWRVGGRDDYPADFSQISQLLLKFADLKSAQNQEVEPSQLGRFDLLPPGAATNSGTRVEFKDAGGKTINSVLLGKHHMNIPPANSPPGGMGDEGNPNGRYVMVGSDTKTIRLVSDPLDSAGRESAGLVEQGVFQRPKAGEHFRAISRDDQFLATHARLRDK